MQIITYEFPTSKWYFFVEFIFSTFPTRAIHDVFFALSEAIKNTMVNSYHPLLTFFCLSLSSSQSSPLILSLYPFIFCLLPCNRSLFLLRFTLSSRYSSVQGLYQAITLNLFQGNSLTCVTPTKILLLLNHLKTIILKHFTDMLVCNAS